MPGAGSATVAWVPEDSYLGGTTSPTYRVPGQNVRVNTAELNRNLLALVLPDEVEANDYIAQNFEGQLDVQFVMFDDEFHRLVFNDGFTGFTNGLVNSAEWYLGADYIGGTTERQIQGWVPATATINYNGTTELVTVTLSGPYGDEVKNTSITPGTISDSKGNEVPGHGAELQIDGSRVTKLQSATINLDGISRLQFDSNTPKPTEAVAGNVSETVELAATYEGPTLYEYALGSASATDIEDFIASHPATVTFDHDGTTIADYSFGTTKPNNYDWTDLVNNDADLNENVTFNATGITASDPTA